jgi:hypothetical protein
MKIMPKSGIPHTKSNIILPPKKLINKSEPRCSQINHPKLFFQQKRTGVFVKRQMLFISCTSCSSFRAAFTLIYPSPDFYDSKTLVKHIKIAQYNQKSVAGTKCEKYN